MSDNNLVKMQTFVSEYHKEKIVKIAEARKISVSRVISFAIDNELLKDKPFEFDYTIPEEKHCDNYLFIHEAGKLMQFMDTLKTGAGLDILMLLRFKIGIPEKGVFLYALKELLDKDMIEGFKPIVRKGRTPHADDYLYYRVKTNNTKKDKRYKEYMKLKKEFEE